jgi:predicted metal-binding membrane protein
MPDTTAPAPAVGDRRPVPAAHGDRLAVGLTVAAAAAAWVALTAATHSSARDHLAHHAPSTSAGATGQAAFAAGWLAMVAAMMLPPSLRYVRVLSSLLAGRRRRVPLLAAGLGGFALVWMLVGEMFQLGDLGVHALVDATPWVRDRPHLVAAASLAVAGAYQLTPLKARCLRACRQPAGFVARGWHGRAPATELFRVGSAYGWSCAGCCWALMLVMFAAGLTSLWLMAALAAVMLAEREVPRAEVAVTAVAAGLLLAAGLVAAGLLPGFSPA